MSRRIDICPTCKGKGKIIVDNWLTEGMSEEELAKKKKEALADIVEVVRCKDCVNYCGFEHCKNGICDKDVVSKKAVYPNDYCSCGERRANDGTN